MSILKKATPEELEAKQERKRQLSRAGIEKEGVTLDRPLTGWVQLATGELVRSKTEPLIASR